jgi:hypothetical protein
MPVRIDHQGFLIDHLGHRLAQGNDEASRAKRMAKIVAAWKENGTGEGPPKGVTTMQVVKGDCQWTIFGGAGANEYRDYNTVNKHIDDPDLIIPGDIIFVDKTIRLSTDINGNDNMDIFADQQQARAEAGESPETLRQDDAVFLASADGGGGVKDGVFTSIFERLPASDDTEKGGSTSRQALVEGYLLTFEPWERPQKLQELRTAYDPKKIFGDKDFPDDATAQTYEGYESAFDGAAKALGLPVTGPGTGDTGSTGDTGTGNQPVSGPTNAQGQPVTDQPIVDIYAAAKTSGGNMEDPTLRNRISDFVKVRVGSPQEVNARVRQLLELDFGPHDKQVEQYIAQFLGQEITTKFTQTADGGNARDAHAFLKTYLQSFKDKGLQQRALDAVLNAEFPPYTYYRTRKTIKSVAEELDLKHNIFSIT